LHCSKLNSRGQIKTDDVLGTSDVVLIGLLLDVGSDWDTVAVIVVEVVMVVLGAVAVAMVVLGAVAVAMAAAQSSSGVLAIGHRHVHTLAQPVLSSRSAKNARKLLASHSAVQATWLLSLGHTITAVAVVVVVAAAAVVAAVVVAAVVVVVDDDDDDDVVVVVVVVVVVLGAVAVAIAAAQSSSGVLAIGHKHVHTLAQPVISSMTAKNARKLLASHSVAQAISLLSLGHTIAVVDVVIAVVDAVVVVVIAVVVIAAVAIVVVVVVVLGAVAVAMAAAQSSSGVLAIGHRHVHTLAQPVMSSRLAKDARKLLASHLAVQATWLLSVGHAVDIAVDVVPVVVPVVGVGVDVDVDVDVDDDDDDVVVVVVVDIDDVVVTVVVVAVVSTAQR